MLKRIRRKLLSIIMMKKYKIMSTLKQCNTHFRKSTTLCDERHNSNDWKINNDVFGKFEKLLQTEAYLCDGIDHLSHIDAEREDRANAALRDTTVHQLISLNRIYLHCPEQILSAAVQLIDRFLVCVKVKPKYMFCVSMACLQLSLQQQNYSTDKVPEMPGGLSQVPFTASDLRQMETIIRERLASDIRTVTVYDYLTALTGSPLSPLLASSVRLAQSAYETARYRPSVTALAIVLLHNYHCDSGSQTTQPAPTATSLRSVIAISDSCRVDLNEVYECTTRLLELHTRSQLRSQPVWTYNRLVRRRPMFSSLSSENRSFRPVLESIRE